MHLLVVVCVALICAGSVLGDDKYSLKLSNLNFEEIKKNERLLNAYMVCLSENKGCTPEGEELRQVLPDAIRTGCEKCTDDHKAVAKKVAAFLMKEKPQLWQKLVQLYDPDKTFRTKYKDQLVAAGFAL